ncbi:hypothetical protein NE237_004934 [Protea cynaroides]|uniref:OBG-type G domain-containing protein n=1 Tax=Protea cynaroides TaxID=273540 RepID=A0A9Q0QU22_9MAGN|nr:hypothetical protein NE237_004934 [Protea cynaroides]
MSDVEWAEDEEQKEKIVQYNVAELKEPGQKKVVAQGGEGGLGNVSSAKVSMVHKHLKHVNHKDAVPLEPFQGLSLLWAIMPSQLRPNIGNLNNADFFSITVADIPGLIKGAHENCGLGHAFLRHIERTKVLAYVVDLEAALNGRKGIPPWEQLRELS